MFERHKQPSLEMALLIVLVVISVFSLGYYNEDEVSAGNKITGMAVQEESVSEFDVCYHPKTEITLIDGSTKLTKEIKQGDQVILNYNKDKAVISNVLKTYSYQWIICLTVDRLR